MLTKVCVSLETSKSTALEIDLSMCKVVLLLWIFFVSCLSCFLVCSCSLVVTCRERTDFFGIFICSNKFCRCLLFLFQNYIKVCRVCTGNIYTGTTKYDWVKIIKQYIWEQHQQMSRDMSFPTMWHFDM